MHSILEDLEQATADLATILDVGLLGKLKESIAYALRGQGNDYDAFPGLKRNVEQFGEMLAGFTGMPLALCKLAALNQLLPDNRNKQSLEVIHEFAEQLRAEKAKRRASFLVGGRT